MFLSRDRGCIFCIWRFGDIFRLSGRKIFDAGDVNRENEWRGGTIYGSLYVDNCSSDVRYKLQHVVSGVVGRLHVWSNAPLARW